MTPNIRNLEAIAPYFTRCWYPEQAARERYGRGSIRHQCAKIVISSGVHVMIHVGLEYSCCEQGIFLTQVLPNIGLAEGYNASRVQLSGLCN